MGDYTEWEQRQLDEDSQFTNCGRGNRAPRDCWCDACVNHWDDEYHRRREDGWFGWDV